MTSMFVVAVLIALNIAYFIYDGQQEQAARQMDDYRRVEFKRVVHRDAY